MSKSDDVSKKLYEDMVAKSAIFNSVMVKKEAGQVQVVPTGDERTKFSFSLYDMGSQNKAAQAALAIAGPAVPAEGGDQVMVSAKKYRDLEEKVDRLQKAQAESNQFVGALANHVKKGFSAAFTMMNASNELAFENNTKRGDRTDGLFRFDTESEKLISFQDVVVKNKALTGSVVLLDSDDEDSAAGSKSKVAPAKTKAERKAALLKQLAEMSDDEDHAVVPTNKKQKLVDPLAAKKSLLKEMMDYAELTEGSREILNKAKEIDPNMLIAKQTRLRTEFAKAFNDNKTAAPLITYWLDNPFKLADKATLSAYRAYLKDNGFPGTTKFDGKGFDWTA